MMIKVCGYESILKRNVVCKSNLYPPPSSFDKTTKGPLWTTNIKKGTIDTLKTIKNTQTKITNLGNKNNQ